MNRTSYCRLTAVLTSALLLAFAVSPAAADNHRFAPGVHWEDGISTAEPAAPAWTPGAPGQTAAPGGAGRGAQPQATVQKPNAGKAQPVTLGAPSAVLMEARSGRVLFEKNAHERRAPASVTKIMTLVVAFDAIRDGKVAMSDKVTISDEAAAQIGTIIFADGGETFTLKELLTSVAVGSANDAAVAVAEHISGSLDGFVQAMNEKAAALGMRDTQFANPTGLSDDKHFTSAYDIALMSRYAAVNYPELVQLTSIYGEDLQVPWRKNGPTFRLWNNNKLLTWYSGADGLKTGWTQAAGYCLAATAQRNGVRMISVIMGADSWKSRNAEAARLLDYGFANYTSVEVAPAGKSLGLVSITRGKVPKVDAVPMALFAVSVGKGEQAKVKTEVRLKTGLEAPVDAGQVVGEIVATMDGKELARMPLVAAKAVPRANLLQSVWYHVGRVFGGGR